MIRIIQGLSVLAFAFLASCGMMGGMREGQDCSQGGGGMMGMGSDHKSGGGSCDAVTMMALLRPPDSSASQPSGTTPSGTTPALVLSSVPADGKVTLAWNAVTGAEYYPVYFSTATSVGRNVPGSTLAGNPVTPGLTVTGLTNGTAYYFVVYAYNGSQGYFVTSNVVAGVPQASHEQ